MNAVEMATACAAALANPAGGQVGIMLKIEKGKTPRGFPRGELMVERRRQDGVVERVSFYDPARVLEWMRRNGLVSIRIDGDQVLINTTKEPKQ